MKQHKAIRHGIAKDSWAPGWYIGAALIGVSYAVVLIGQVVTHVA